MASVVYSASALEDLRRLTAFLLENDPPSALATSGLIVEAVDIPAAHPLIGRPIEGCRHRELVISRGRSGYVALYSYESARDEVIVHAVRHQREAGFDEG